MALVEFCRRLVYLYQSGLGHRLTASLAMGDKDSRRSMSIEELLKWTF